MGVRVPGLSPTSSSASFCAALDQSLTESGRHSPDAPMVRGASNLPEGSSVAMAASSAITTAMARRVKGVAVRAATRAVKRGSMRCGLRDAGGRTPVDKALRVSGSTWGRVDGPGFRVQGSGLRAQGSGFKVHGSFR